nr:phage tail protein [Pectobacterium carotovorum]
MANLSEQESWIDGIYQLETSDPVVAGPGGISNRQAEQLASRTAYLKKMQETTGESLQKHLAASDPHSQYAPKNSPVLTGTPTAPTTAQTANNTQIATTAFVKSALAALVNGSPAALDTLQELANALGNDPHFSTTVVNAIADVKTDVANKLNAHASILDAHPQYAPKASPAFTGTPTAPTAASSSNDTQLATTAFVKAAVAALVNGSPAALDTLQELANALGNDPNFSTTVLNTLAGKLAKDQNGADIPDAALFRKNINVGEFGHTSVVLGTVDTEQYFNANTPDGNYIVGGEPDVLKIPISDAFLNWRRYVGHDGSLYGVLTIVGFYTPSGGQFRQFHKILIKGRWQQPTEVFNDSCRLINGEVSATANPFKGVGFYNGDYGNWGRPYGVVLQSYLPGGGAISLMQSSTSVASSQYELFGRNVVVSEDGTATYGPPVQFYHTEFRPSATDVGAFPLGFTGNVTGDQVAWDANSGLYRTIVPGASQMIVHFGGKEASCTALQFKAHFGNGGLFYRSSRDMMGFENGFEQIYTTQHKPTASDIGALPTSELAGMPQLFPGAVAPAGWLKCNGQQFDKAQYPILTSRYPSGFLPDLRGEFVRGWDDGRGADAGRALMSAQGDAIRNITGSLYYGYDADGVIKSSSSTGALYYDTGEKLHDTESYMSVVNSSTANAWYPAKLDVSRVIPTANENRPHNIAFNYIVRAA